MKKKMRSCHRQMLFAIVEKNCFTYPKVAIDSRKRKGINRKIVNLKAKLDISWMLPVYIYLGKVCSCFALFIFLNVHRRMVEVKDVVAVEHEIVPPRSFHCILQSYLNQQPPYPKFHLEIYVLYKPKTASAETLLFCVVTHSVLVN